MIFFSVFWWDWGKILKKAKEFTQGTWAVLDTTFSKVLTQTKQAFKWLVKKDYQHMFHHSFAWFAVANNYKIQQIFTLQIVEKGQAETNRWAAAMTKLLCTAYVLLYFTPEVHLQETSGPSHYRWQFYLSNQRWDFIWGAASSHTRVVPFRILPLDPYF